MNAPSTKERDRLGGKSEAAQNQVLNTQPLADTALLGNSREIIRIEPGSEVHRVFTITSHYEVRTADQQWRYAELWEAIFQQIRLTQSLAAKEQHVS